MSTSLLEAECSPGDVPHFQEVGLINLFNCAFIFTYGFPQPPEYFTRCVKTHLFKKIYLFNFFIFGCIGSSLLRAGFL